MVSFGMTSIFTNLFAAVVCILLSNAGMKFVRDEFSSGTFVFARIPSWYAEIIIPVGFGLFVFHFLVRAVGSVEELRKKERPG